MHTVQGTFPVISQRLNTRPVDISGLNNNFAIPSAFEGEVLVESQATRKAILERLRALALASSPTDIVVIFLAGHGTELPHNLGFYFLPYDAPAPARSDRTPLPPETMAKGLLSEGDITQALEPLRARYSALILDTCSSGTILEGQQLGPLEEHSRRFMRLAYEKGMHVVVAAQSEKVAVERREYGHGVLAHALFDLGLLDDGADQSPRDGLIELGEWLAWGARKADALEREFQGDGHDRPIPQYVPPATAWPESAVLRATISFEAAASGGKH